MTAVAGCLLMSTEARVISMHAGGRYSAVGRWSRNQGLGFNELLQTRQRTHGNLLLTSRPTYVRVFIVVLVTSMFMPRNSVQSPCDLPFSV